MTLHAEPTHCRHSSDCTCPEFEPASLSEDSATILGACDLCDHAAGWHLPPLRLTAAEAKEKKSNDGEALEHCKTKGCGCPVWASAEGGKECALCGCKKGWHKWKEVQEVQSPVPAVNSMASAGPSSPPTFSSPPLRAPPRPPTPPRPYVAPSSPVSPPPSEPRIDKGKGRAAEPEPVVGSHPLAALERVAHIDQPRRISPPCLHVDTSPPRVHGTPPPPARDLPNSISNMGMRSEETFRTIATTTTTGSRYELEDDESVRDLRFDDLSIGRPASGAGATWGGARIRDPDSERSSIVEVEPLRRYSGFGAGGSDASGASRGPEMRRMSEDSVGPSTASTSLRTNSIRSTFGARRGSVNTSTATAPIPIVGSPSHDIATAYTVASSQPRPIVAASPPAREAPHRGASIASSSVGTSSAWSMYEDAAGPQQNGLERVFSNRSITFVSSGPKLYSTKNLDLQVTPALDSARFSPGQEFKFVLTLGPKVSLAATFEKVEVRLIGKSYACLDPPDDHDFLVLTTSFIPLSSHVISGVGQRSFSWTTTLPARQTCNCGEPHEVLNLPSSYTGQHFRVSYRMELVAKKTGRLSKNEKISETFIVYSPLPEHILHLPMTLKTTPMEQGRSGAWITATSRRVTSVDAQKSKLICAELALQLLPSSSSAFVRIPWRVTLTFDTKTSGSDYLNHNVLAQLEKEFTLVLSRRIIFLSSGDKKGKAKMEELPPLKVMHVEREKTPARIVINEMGLPEWQIGGVIEVDRREARSLVTCNVHVRYYLSARAPLKCGLDQPIECQARGINLELFPVTPTPLVASPTSITAPQLILQPSTASSGRPASVSMSASLNSQLASTSLPHRPPAMVSPPIASTSRSIPMLSQINPGPTTPDAPSPATSNASDPYFSAPALPRQEGSVLDFPLDYDELEHEPPPPFEAFPDDSETVEERGRELVGFEYMSGSVH